MAAAEPSSADSRRYVVGYTLAPKMQQSFIQSSLLSRAAARGVDLVRVDEARPLADDWRAQLQAFSARYPSVTVVDPPHAIDRLHNRISSMLQVVSELDVPLTDCHHTFGIPSQVIVYDATALTDSALLTFVLTGRARRRFFYMED